MRPAGVSTATEVLRRCRDEAHTVVSGEGAPDRRPTAFVLYAPGILFSSDSVERTTTTTKVQHTTKVQLTASPCEG